MRLSPASLHLTRRDPSYNMSRFYALSLEPTLFGEVMLIRTWGRIGTGGQVRIETFSQTEEATEALHKLYLQKLKRGYCAESDIAEAMPSTPGESKSLAVNGGVEADQRPSRK